MKKTILFLLCSICLLLQACANNSDDIVGLPPSHAANSQLYGYYTGSIVYPDNSSHAVTGFFAGSNTFLLQETGNNFGYKLIVSSPMALYEVYALPLYSTLYMKGVYSASSTFSANNFIAGINTSTDVENGNAIAMTNVSQNVSYPNIQFNFTINDTTNPQFTGSYAINLTLSTNPNDALSIPNPITSNAYYTNFTEESWITTDPQTNLTLSLTNASDCGNALGTCQMISGIESGGNGNSDELGTDGNFCTLSLTYTMTTTNNAYFYPSESCNNQTYVEMDHTYFAWISVDNSGNKTLHTIYDYENLGILADTWTPAGVLISRN